MTFNKWLRAQFRRNDPVGDLARDFRRHQPKATGRQRIRTPARLFRRLEEFGACHGAFEALDRAEAEWRKQAAQ